MDKDYKNRIIVDVRWTRLKKYQKNTLAMKYVTLEEEIKRLAYTLHLPKSCTDNALVLAKQLVGRGFSPQALAAAALIMACRMLKMPRPITDFVSFIDSVEKVKRILRELSTAVKNVPRVEQYVAIIAARVNAPPAAAAAAIELIRRNRKSLQGRNPWAAAAAALWLSGVDISMLRQYASSSSIKKIACILK
jgi:transcription initiation factor TFIIB